MWRAIALMVEADDGFGRMFFPMNGIIGGRGVMDDDLLPFSCYLR